MTRQSLTPQLCTKTTLLNPTYSSLSGVTGIQWQNTGKEVLAIINGSTASTATINLAVTVEGQAVTPFSVTLPTSNTTPQLLGPFDRNYTQADGNIYIDLSSITGVTVAVLQLPGVN
jgi:hypothetical protein